jgi:hypothetical protein
MLGWNICRVWTLDWWENPTEVLKAIEEALENAKNKIPEPLIAKNQNEESMIVRNEEENHTKENMDISTENEYENQENEDTNPKGKYIYAYLPSANYSSEVFFFPEYQNYIIRQIQTVIETEAPISRSLLCKRVLNSWGISRLGSRLDTYFDELLSKIDCYRKTDEEFVCIWKSEEQMTSYRTFRPVSERNALDLPPEEVANGIKYLLEAQISLPTRDLSRVTAQLFGFARTGNNVDTAMFQGIREAVKRGYIKVENGRSIIL